MHLLSAVTLHPPTDSAADRRGACGLSLPDGRSCKKGFQRPRRFANRSFSPEGGRFQTIREFLMNDSPSPARTLGQILDETVARYPERDALVYFNQGVRRSWRDFARSVDELACGLMALGVAPGEKVAVWATNVRNAKIFSLSTAFAITIS